MRKTIFLLLPILFLLHGCLNYNQETKLKTDGSGDMFLHYWMKVATQQDSALVEQFGVFQKDSVTAQFSSKFNKIENVEIYRDDADSTIHAKIEFSFQSLDSLNHIKAFREANFSIKDGAAGQKIFSQFIPPQATGFGFEGKDIMLTYIYYVPGEIITHNAHELSGNKLVWSYKLNEIGMGKTITATFRPFKLKETPIWIYALALFVLAVVIVFLFRKNKS